MNSPGSINASDDDGQLLAYSDPASADEEGPSGKSRLCKNTGSDCSQYK